MSERLKVAKLFRTCDACPSQWDGLLDDGRKIYGRVRWGWASLRVAPHGDSGEYAAVNGEEILGTEWGDGEWTGYMSDDEFREWTKDVLDLSAIPAPENTEGR